MKFKIHFFFLFCCLIPCSKASDVQHFLPSWNEGQTKSAIITFVEKTVDPKSKHFIATEDRIVTFDNDGTLWGEQPMYFQFFFAMDRIRELADDHPEWKDTHPYQAVIENDTQKIAQFNAEDLMHLVFSAHSQTNTNEFEQLVNTWLSTAQHPVLKKPFTQLVYQPMLELLDYLRVNHFKIFIVSGGSIEFIRAWAEQVYGIPKDRIIGSTLKTHFSYENGQTTITRLPELEFNNDHEGKALSINKFIGRKPVMSVGNSDGDLEMMQWTASGKGSRFMLYLHHTDVDREWAYDKHSNVGRLDKGLTQANNNNWTVIDMKKDWKVIFPFEL